MAIWFTSDTHFNHENIIKYCNRPFKDWTHMNEEMIARWNSRVKPEDTLYFIGDFAMGDKESIPGFLARLNGHKHLIYGNHDDLRYHPVVSSFNTKTQAGWESINEDLYVEVDGKVVWMAHIPFGVDNDKRAYVRPTQRQRFDVVLNGHVHDKWVLNDAGSINVGCDNFGFYPQSLAELLERAKYEKPFDSSTFLPV